MGIAQAKAFAPRFKFFSSLRPKAAKRKGNQLEGEVEEEGKEDVEHKKLQPTVGFHDVYKLEEKLGNGAYAMVYKCRRRQGSKECCAVKVIDLKDMKEEDRLLIEGEISILKSLDHPYIVRLLHVFRNDRRIYIVQELCAGGELFDAIVARVRYSEEDARQVMRAIMEAVSYAHGRGIVHRDLKPENILLSTTEDATHVKLCDFGMSHQILGLESLRTVCGSPGYMAPEIVKQEPYDEKVDVWAAGVILFCLLAGFQPFEDQSMPLMLAKIKKGYYSMRHPVFWHVSDEAKDLIKHMLVVHPQRRLTARACLEHKWFALPPSLLQHRQLSMTQEQLKAHIKQRKFHFRSVAGAVILANRLCVLRMGESLSGKKKLSSSSGSGSVSSSSSSSSSPSSSSTSSSSASFSDSSFSSSLDSLDRPFTGTPACTAFLPSSSSSTTTTTSSSSSSSSYPIIGATTTSSSTLSAHPTPSSFPASILPPVAVSSVPEASRHLFPPNRPSLISTISTSSIRNSNSSSSNSSSSSSRSSNNNKNNNNKKKNNNYIACSGLPTTTTTTIKNSKGHNSSSSNNNTHNINNINNSSKGRNSSSNTDSSSSRSRNKDHKTNSSTTNTSSSSSVAPSYTTIGGGYYSCTSTTVTPPSTSSSSSTASSFSQSPLPPAHLVNKGKDISSCSSSSSTTTTLTSISSTSSAYSSYSSSPSPPPPPSPRPPLVPPGIRGLDAYYQHQRALRLMQQQQQRWQQRWQQQSSNLPTSEDLPSPPQEPQKLHYHLYQQQQQ